MIGTILGMGIVTAILILFYFKYKENGLDENTDKNLFGFVRTLIPLLLLFFIISGIFLISKASLDATIDCTSEINSTTNTGNTTSYTYVDVCSADKAQAPTTFYKGIVWLQWIVYTIIFTGFVFRILIFFGVLIPKK